jgi:hypothetical protein
MGIGQFARTHGSDCTHDILCTGSQLSDRLGLQLISEEKIAGQRKSTDNCGWVGTFFRLLLVSEIFQCTISVCLVCDPQPEAMESV